MRMRWYGRLSPNTLDHRHQITSYCGKEASEYPLDRRAGPRPTFRQYDCTREDKADQHCCDPDTTLPSTRYPDL